MKVVQVGSKFCEILRQNNIQIVYVSYACYVRLNANVIK